MSGWEERGGRKHPATGRKHPPTGREHPASRVDAARRAAYDVLRAVAESDAYANLVLPPLLRERHLSRRDAAFATELAYGTLRLRGRYDAILALASTRPLGQIDPRVLDALRLGAHQILGMRVPVHAAVGETVDLVREAAGAGASSFANAVLRQVARADASEWERRLAERARDREELRSQVTAHPVWIVRALRESLALDLAETGRLTELDSELDSLLAADNAPPAVTLAARPGLVDAAELAQASEEGLIEAFGGVPTAWTLHGGSPERVAAVRQGRMGVQDAGSQLVTLALAAAQVVGRDSQWADLCAGPGGKAALLGALLARRRPGDGDAPGSERAHLVAGEVQPHRAGLVRRSVKALTTRYPGLVDVREWDGRTVGDQHPEEFDRVLVDAPCTGLGALRRRPEARWRRQPGDLPPLTGLQRELLDSAAAATRPGGVVAYVTCSPHVAETRSVVEAVVRARGDLEILDAAATVRAVAPDLPGLAGGPFVQLWPHRQGTDAMFLALLRRRP